MKQQFAGFYGPSEHDIDSAYKDKNTLFIFDTNILLSLYRCEESTRLQFLEVWRNLKDQVWIPFNVCLEYQRNRLGVINSSRNSLKSISKVLNNGIDTVFMEFEKSGPIRETLSRYSNLRTELGELKDSLSKIVSEFTLNSLESRRQNINFINSHDEIRDLIDELTAGCIGEEPDQDFIDKVNKEGATRYKYSTGPGFADAKEKQNERFSFNGINFDAQYGDLYIWKQIVQKAKDQQYKNIIYVTNDEKEDFVYKINGKIRGPSESLVTEIKKEANIEVFLLNQIDSFLHHAVKSLNAKIDEPSITELASAATSSASDLNVLNLPYYLCEFSSQALGTVVYQKSIEELESELAVLNNDMDDIKHYISYCDDMIRDSDNNQIRDNFEKEKLVAFDKLNSVRYHKIQLVEKLHKSYHGGFNYKINGQ
ncbi:PIN-like domain-containing protein [Enterobacter sp. BNK-13]|uniref:PIN-like domain-containing protein n=1 Tax=Enterobacter sp. BNK-13 TaxID=3376150 RepID=UPI003B42FE4C